MTYSIVAASQRLSTSTRKFEGRSVPVDVVVGSYDILDGEGNFVDRHEYEVAVHQDKSIHRIWFNNKTKSGGAYQGEFIRKILKDYYERSKVKITGFVINPEGKKTDHKFVIEIPKTTGCNACKAIFNIVARIGCAVSFATICFLASLSGYGGVVCMSIAAAICGYIGQQGASNTADVVCKAIKFCP